MRVLGLDTSTLTAGVAIVGERGVIAEARHEGTRRTSDLLVTIDATCKRAGIAPADLDAVAVGAGPGSFTGLRIGMATAKGIAFAAGRPLWLVSSLAALACDAEVALPRPSVAEPVAPMIFALLDARRGEVYAGCYRTGVLIDVERVLPPRDLLSWITALAGDAPIRCAGDALQAHGDVLAPLAERWVAGAESPSGSAVATLALAGARVDDLTGGAPTYIRPSEAEVMYPDGVPGALPRR